MLQFNRRLGALHALFGAISVLATSWITCASGQPTCPECGGPTRLVAGPYNAATGESQLTQAQRAMFTSIGAELGHLDASGDIPWPQDPNAPFNPPLWPVMSWIQSRIPDPATYDGHIAFDWEGPRYLALFQASHPNQSVIEEEFIAVVNLARQLCPNARIGFYGVPFVPTYAGGLPQLAPQLQLNAELIARCTALYPAFFFDGRNSVPGYTDAQFIEAAWDILLDTDLCQDKPVYYFTWARQSPLLPPPLGMSLVSEDTWRAAALAAVGTNRLHPLAGIWMWHPDEYWHTVSQLKYTSNTISADSSDNTIRCAAGGFNQVNWIEFTSMIRTIGFNTPTNNGVFNIVPKGVNATQFKIFDSKLVTEPAGGQRTIRVEPYYTAFQTENPYYGGVYPWESYREIRGQRLLTILHNVLRNANTPLPAFECPADVNDDHTVDLADVLAVVNAWGACPLSPLTCPANVIGSGLSGNQVDGADLAAVIASQGACP